MLLFLSYLFFLLLINSKAFAGAWVQEPGSFHFDHCFSGFFGSKYSSVDNTQKLEFLVRSIEGLGLYECQILSGMLNRTIQKAQLATQSLTPCSPAIAFRYRKYLDQAYIDKIRGGFAKMWEQDKKRADVMRKLLYKTVPRYHYHVTMEYGLAQESTIGCNFLYDKFQSAFLENTHSFCLQTYWRRQLFESQAYVVSVQPYAQIKYCKALSGGIGADLLLGYSKTSQKSIGTIKLNKTFRNHSAGLYFPYNKFGLEDTEFKTENTIGRELDSGFGFYAQHFWTRSISFTRIAVPFSCHRSQTSVYKKNDKYTFSLGVFVEHTQYKDIDGIMNNQRFYPKFNIVYKRRGKHIPIKRTYENIKKAISDRKLFGVFNLGINGSISWHF
jgi:hypothetical protein